MNDNTPATAIRRMVVKAFVYEPPMLNDYDDIPEITLTVIYFEDEEKGVTEAQAWLESDNRPTMKFLCDVFLLNAQGLTEQEIENKIITEFNGSENVRDGIEALIAEDYDLFVFDYTDNEIARYNAAWELFVDEFGGIMEYLNRLKGDEE